MNDCQDCKIKVTLCLNTFNEGAEVARTIESFRKNAGKDVIFSCVVIADGTTDGSCDELPEDVMVIKPTERIGIGQAKSLSVRYALDNPRNYKEHTGSYNSQPDVIMHSDAHGRLLVGTLRDIADVAMERSPCIVTPAVGPLNCAKAKDCKQHGIKERCQVDCPDIEDNTEIPNNCYYGAGLKWKGKGIAADWMLDRPAEKVAQRQGVSPSAFAYTPESLEAIGGWNEYPGHWGSQELGITLRAWFADVPIYALRQDYVCVLHRYRSWNHPRGKAIAPYGIDDAHREANNRYAYGVVFDANTFNEVWMPWFDRSVEHGVNKEAEKMIAESGLSVQQVDFILECKKKTDERFFREVLHRPHPLEHKMAEDAKRGLYFIKAGLGNVLMCVPAMKALAELSGEPIDVVNQGLTQREDVIELLEKQPFIRKVIDQDPEDLSYYRFMVGSYWGKTPPFVPQGAQAADARKAWRTIHEVESNIEAIRKVGYKGIIPSAGLISWSQLPQPVEGLENDYVVIGMGHSGGNSNKAYPHWQVVCTTLKEHGVKLVFLGSSHDDQPWMDSLGLNMCGKTSIGQAAGIFWPSRLYVGIDNGLAHLAAAMGTPGILLYGSSRQRKNIPWSTNVTILHSTEVDCAPCWGDEGRRECPGGKWDVKPCMETLRPEYVSRKVLAALERPGWEAADDRELFLTAKQKWVNQDVYIAQCFPEFQQLISILRREPIYTIVEIGVKQGGWLGVVADCLGWPLNIIAIDPKPEEEWDKTQEALRKRGHNLTFFLGPSNNVLSQVQDFVGGKIDLLHIDGDHHVPHPRRDYENYFPLVRKGGLIILHDIANHEYPEVGELYAEIVHKQPSEGVALVSYQPGEMPAPEHLYGIGVIRKLI